MNKEEWEEYITWEERVTDKLERWVKYNKPITREQAEETIDFICEQDNVIDRKIRELEKYKNIVDEVIEYLRDIRQSTFTKYDSNEWNNCLSFNDDIKPLLDKLKELKGE